MSEDRFRKQWAEMLRAGALEIAEKADAIVGDLPLNIALSVEIRLGQSGEFPTILIMRELASRPMNEVLKSFHHVKDE